MPSDSGATRRAFLTGGALLAPIGVSVAAALQESEDARVRLRRLEDEAAIRSLHDAWIRRVNSGMPQVEDRVPVVDDGEPEVSDAERVALPDWQLRRINVDHAGAAERIDIAPDGGSARGYFDHAIETEARLPADCTLAQMAHAQGSGTLRGSGRALVTIECVKRGGSWRIAGVTVSPRSRAVTTRGARPDADAQRWPVPQI